LDLVSQLSRQAFDSCQRLAESQAFDSVALGGAKGGHMTLPMSVFLTEGNVEIYLSRLHTTWDPEERDKLLRLLVQAQMGASREHLENGERRVNEGRDRVITQRRPVIDIPLPERARVLKLPCCWRP